MLLIYNIILFILGLAALLWGAERLVDSSLSLAKKSHLSPIVIGITVLSIGTSLPEIATSIISFLSGHPNIATGNIIGSELVQITLILGIVALIMPLKGDRKQILKYGISMMVAVLLSFIVMYNHIVTWYEGLFLVSSYIIYLYFVVRKDEKSKKKEVSFEEKNEKTKSWFNIISFIVLGLVLTIFGTKILISSTVNLARFFGVSEFIISVFLVGLGTSLPELVVSGIAAWKREFEMSIGNLFGSNITDPTFSFGIGALFVKKANISPLAGNSLLFLLVVFAFVTGLFYFRKKISWKEAIILILVYGLSYFVL